MQKKKSSYTAEKYLGRVSSDDKQHMNSVPLWNVLQILCCVPLYTCMYISALGRAELLLLWCLGTYIHLQRKLSFLNHLNPVEIWSDWEPEFVLGGSFNPPQYGRVRNLWHRHLPSQMRCGGRCEYFVLCAQLPISPSVERKQLLMLQVHCTPSPCHLAGWMWWHIAVTCGWINWGAETL